MILFMDKECKVKLPRREMRSGHISCGDHFEFQLRLVYKKSIELEVMIFAYFIPFNIRLYHNETDIINLENEIANLYYFPYGFTVVGPFSKRDQVIRVLKWHKLK